MKTYTVKLIMNKQPEDDEAEDASKVTVLAPTANRAERQALLRQAKKRMFQGLEQSNITDIDVRLSIDEHNWISTHSERLIQKKKDRYDFKYITDLLASKSQIFSYYWDTRGKSYLVALVLMPPIDSDTTHTN